MTEMVVAHSGGSVGHITVEYIPLVLPIVLITLGLIVLWRRSGS